MYDYFKRFSVLQIMYQNYYYEKLAILFIYLFILYLIYLFTLLFIFRLYYN